MLPLRFSSPDQFSAARDFLVRARYEEQTACERLGLKRLHQVLTTGQTPTSPASEEILDPLDALLKVFLTGSHVRRDRLGKFIPADVQETMEGLGVLCMDAANADLCYSPVVLYPVDGLYFASDRWTTPDGTEHAVPKDYVFPAMHPLTHEFLEILPQTPCSRLLDLCAGTGVGALMAATRYSHQAWAVDITERSAHFAEFNRRLNGVSNATVMQGNLYEPLTGMQFDRIVAHPPFVPSLKPGSIYADGGDDGEFVTRAIVQGLPHFLEPHGCFYCVTMGVEREGEPFEDRVRQWLGAGQSAFDILFIADATQGPAQFAFRATRNAKGNWEQMDQWCAHLHKLKIKNLVHGLLLIQRTGGERTTFTVRRKKGHGSKGREAEWLRVWETAWADPSSRARLLDSRPLASVNVELHVVHIHHEGPLVPSKFTLTMAYPYSVEYECPSWVATLVSRCDGKSTAIEYFEAGKRELWIPTDLSREVFATTVGQLVSNGILELEAFTPPRQRNSGTGTQVK